MQGIVKEVDKLSVFLWADEIVKRKDKAVAGVEVGAEEGKVRDRGEAEEEVTWVVWIWEWKWILDQMR